MSITIVQCYFPLSDFQGFGAYLASTLFLHYYCLQKKYKLINSYEFHSAFKNSFFSNPLPGIKPNTTETIPIIHTFDELEDYIASQSSSVIYISFYRGTTDILFNRTKYLESIDFIKSQCLNVSDTLTKKINTLFETILMSKQQYIAVHLRVGDEDLVQNEGIYKPLYNCFLKNIENLILPLLENDKIIIISDNITLKKILKTNYAHPNLYIMETIPKHTGIQTHIEDSCIDDTLVDFFILAYSKQILIVSAQHQHPIVSSFFSRYCGCIYNIPTKIKKIQLEIFNNKTSYQVKNS